MREIPFGSQVAYANCGGARRAVAGRGKRGGLRIIYYLRSKQGEIWLLTLYAKCVAESISGRALKKIKEEIDG